MYRWVIFDLDGTVGDTLPLAITAFRETFRELAGGNISDDGITRYFGPSEEGTLRGILPNHVQKGLALYLKHYAELHDSMCPEPFGGVRELIAEIKRRGAVCALVTGKARASLGISLEKFGMTGAFDAIETGIAERPTKVEGIKRVLEKFGAAPEETIYVGDAPGDIAAARELSCHVASAAWASTAETDVLEKMNPGMVF
ncbi:MAG: HAD family hydrolase [Synergistaceae bacterium]|jgi:phosphoglycolate phosphatase/pyrophosphatase PpaX|nr:HAD family hydrolase [Synergistaceae bacterium]